MAKIDTGWTEAYGTSERVRGLDHLSFESTAENIYDQVTPGFTNLARRARYYALYCWILHDYFGGGHEDEEFRPFFRRREHAYALACLSHDHKAGAVGERGIQGSIRAKRNWDAGDDPVDLSRSHIDTPLGGYSLYYRNAMQRVGLIYLEGAQARLTETNSGGPSGRTLAEAFQAAIEDTDYFEHYRDEYEVPRFALEEYGRAACVCGMADSRDGEVLRQALLQLDPPEPEPAVRSMHLSRAQTLTLIFDALKNCGGESMGDAAWRGLLFYGSYEDGRPYDVPGPLADNARTWGMYQQREYHVYALTSLWVALLAWLRERRVATLEEWIAELDGTVDIGRAGERFGLDLRRRRPSEMTLQDMLDRVAVAAGDQGGFVPDLCDVLEQSVGRNAPFSENAIHASLDGGAEMDLADYVGSALWLSIVLFARTYRWLWKDPASAALARTGGPRHWSVESYFRELDARRERSALGFLSWLYQGLVRQHLSVALSKMPLDTFMLLYEDGALHYRAMDWPQFTADRYETMLIVCQDVGWIENSYDRQTLTLLGEGALSQALGALE